MRKGGRKEKGESGWRAEREVKYKSLLGAWATQKPASELFVLPVHFAFCLVAIPLIPATIYLICLSPISILALPDREGGVRLGKGQVKPLP